MVGSTPASFTRRRPGAHDEVVAFLRPNHPPKLRDKPVQINEPVTISIEADAAFTGSADLTLFYYYRSV